ncbi:hypothetical protein [Phycicoccus duodecadis]|uniref:hypothetical protein n=1 Tax=Phycicoccus duodecadis TaxID=173053 RepID=UPI000C701952|nr:hypothetical protein [Phycicoccus duodecadis]
MAVVALAAPAWAYTEVAYARRGTTMTESPPGSIGSVRATLVLENLAAGDVRLLRAQSVTYRGTPDRNALAQKITCEKPDGTIVSESWTGTNLLAVNGLQPLAQRLLFVAPAAGTYYCRERIYVNSHYAQPARATLYSAFVGDVAGPVAAEKVIPATPLRGAVVFFSGTDTTAHRVLPISRYLPPAGATRLQVRNDVFFTNCYGSGGAGCPRGSFPPSGKSTYTHQAFLVPSSPACPVASTTRVTRTFDYLLHHQGGSLDVVAPLPAGGCGSWSSYVVVRRVSGLPFVVQLYPYSQAFMYAS